MAHALVIEDEILIAMQIEAILEAAGISTIDIAAAEADAILLALAHRPDIITSDVRLAKGDGPHAVKTIAQSIGTIPVIFITGSSYFYTFTTYMQKFLVISGGVNAKTASLIMSLALVVFMIMQPIFGLISDKLGIRNNMRLFTGLAMLTVVPILHMIRASDNPYAIFALILIGLTIAAFYTPIAGLLKAELFPAEVRALGVGLPYAIGNALFGGTAEYTALSLRSIGFESAYFYYVAAIVGTAFVSSLMMPDLRKLGYLDGDGNIERHEK